MLKRNSTMLLWVIFLALGSAHAYWVDFGGMGDKAIKAKLIEHVPGRTAVEFRISGFYIKEIDIEGRTCSKIMLPGASIHLRKGYPELPKFAKSIIIPDGGLMNFRIVEIEYESMKVRPIIPSKGNLMRDIDPAAVPYTWSEFYERDEWFPENIIELIEPFILRDFRGQTIRLNPFQYNPTKNELKIAKRVVVEVYKEGEGGENVLVRRIVCS